MSYVVRHAMLDMISNSTRKVYPRMVREIRKEIEDVIAKVGKKGLEVWLNVWDELIRYEGFRCVGRISKPPRGTKSGTSDNQKEREPFGESLKVSSTTRLSGKTQLTLATPKLLHSRLPRILAHLNTHIVTH